MYNIVHLFNPDRGSRYPLMISHGLIAHSDVNASFNTDVRSLGKVVAKGEDFDAIRQKTLEADYIFRPGDEHFGLTSFDAWLDYKQLWNKVIYYDFSDSPAINGKRLDQCRLYAKRTLLGGGVTTFTGKILPLPYAIMPEYLAAEDQEKMLNVAYIFQPKPDGVGEQNRLQVYNRVAHFGFKKSMIGKLTTTNGRRAIFDPPQSNPFFEYLNLLKRTKVIVTCLPDHPGGDSRIWEAFASGSLVVANQELSYLPQGQKSFRPMTDYIAFEPDSEGSIMEALHTVDKLLRDNDLRESIAASGHNHALVNHQAQNRITSVLEVLERSNHAQS